MAILDVVETPTPPQDPRLGRYVQFDPESANFQIRTLLEGRIEISLESREWTLEYWLDQLQIGQCVGGGCAHEVGAEPVSIPVDYALMNNIYNLAQTKYDPWPNTPPEEGTSVLAGLKASQELGYIIEYRCAGAGTGTPLRDAVEGIVNLGPGITGLVWKQGMMQTDANGFIHNSGAVLGGHCVCVIGVVLVWPQGSIVSWETLDLDRSYIIIRNSWGKPWGQNGTCKLTLRDFDALLHEWGEFWIPTLRADPRPAPPVPPTPEPTPPAPPSYLFFSVKGSKVFHDVHRVSGIVEVRFTSYQQAIAAGKRPCLVCKPSG